MTVANGTVRNMGRDGILAGNQARIEHVRAINNNLDGIFTRGGSTLLGNAPVSDCPPGDVNADGTITIDEILAAVNRALNGC